MSIAEQLYIDSLRQSQWLKPDALARYQQPLIERMVRHAATQTDFYPERLAPLFDGREAATAPLDLSRWNEVPIFSRADCADYLDRMRARAVPPDAGPSTSGRSSGSTGRPLEYLRSEIADSAANCELDRTCELFGMDLFGPLAFITADRQRRYPYPLGASYKGWNRTAPDADLFVLDIGTDRADQLEWLRRKQPDHVMTYPFNLREVAEVALAQDAPRPRFSTFLSTGEMLEPDVRDLIVRAFGCRTIDLYGAREIGQIAFQCPEGPGYHICAEAVLCELLDDRGNLVSPGEFGRVVLTSFYNFAMPFIRYEIGDFARAGALPCPCGRGLPSVDQIAGRTRSRFVMPDGSRKRPRGTVLSDMALHLSYKEIQLVQTDLNMLEVRYVPDRPLPPDLAGLKQLVRKGFHDAVDIRLVPVDRIARGAGKAIEQFVTLVG